MILKKWLVLVITKLVMIKGVCALNLYSDTLRMSRIEAEALFLEQNLLLMAERLNIGKAEALVTQAKLWPNPVLTVEEVNLWATERQFMGEELPPFFGELGKNHQISIQIEHLIITAGKRKKLISIEQVSADMAAQYFEELLRSLKIELRNNFTQLQYNQQFRDTYISQLQSVQNLLEAYGRQLEQGNIGKGDYIRLKALELKLMKEINDLERDSNTIQMELKILLNLPSGSFIELDMEGFVPDYGMAANFTLDNLQNLAMENRPDMKLAYLNETAYSNIYSYNHSQRIPDLTLIGGYDRGGNFLLDFVGFGLALDIPVFNRNQGNIKFAGLGLEQSKLLVSDAANRIRAEVVLSFGNLNASRQLYESIDTAYEGELDLLLDSYTSNFTGRNISMLEYLDFQEAYLDNKKIILDLKKELNHAFEEIQYAVGKDLK